MIEQLQGSQQAEQGHGGNAGDERKPDAAADFTARRPALIVMGGFNTTWNRNDGAVRLIAQELSLHPFEPEKEKSQTYPSFDPRWRIDWILISTELQFRHQRRWRDKVSEHLAVTAELVWR